MLSQINFKTISSIFFIVIIGLIQITMMPYFSFGQAIGNLILIFMIILIFKQEYQKALLWVLIGGLILDLSLGIGIGISIVSLSIVFIGLWFFQEKILRSDIYIFVLASTLIASILLDILTILMFNLFGQNLHLLSFWGIFLKQAAINTLILAVIYPLYHYFEDRFYPEKKIKLPEGSI